jgi:hypothetical protein
MITSIVTAAAFAALTAADEVAWSGYVSIGRAFNSRILLTIGSMNYRKIFDGPT